MHTEVVTVTPERAKEFLNSNENNRNISWPLVTKYATDMLAGRWLLNTDAIGFDVTGRLIQGQHRLHAVVLAGEENPDIAVEMLVVEGYPPETFDVLDQGKMRSAAQVIGTHGIPNTTITAAVARQTLYYDRFPNQIWKGSEAISRVEVIEYALANREMLYEAHAGSIKSRQISVVSWMLLHYLVLRDSPNADRWDEFRDAVFKGENLPPGHPALILRNGEVLARWGMAGAQPRAGAYIKVWNAFIEGRTMRALLFRRNELPMPKVL